MNNDLLWEKLELTEDDVIIASTVKSGTTWLQQIVAQLIFKGEFTGKLNEISYWLDTLKDHSEEYILSEIKKQDHRRFFKTHSPASVVLTNKNKKAKFIFITRDFRDVIWSFYNHFVNSKYKILNNSPKNSVTTNLKNCTSPYEFWNIVMDNQELFKTTKNYRIIWSYFNTIKTWLNMRNSKNILILHFNDLKQDLRSNIQLISKFLGYNYSDDIINTIYKKCTFEYMKSNSLKCAPLEFKNSKVFINKGTNKRWKDILTDEDIEEYNKLMGLHFDSNTIKWVENGGSLT